jgi:hypothetical protein
VIGIKDSRVERSVVDVGMDVVVAIGSVSLAIETKVSDAGNDDTTESAILKTYYS